MMLMQTTVIPLTMIMNLTEARKMYRLIATLSLYLCSWRQLSFPEVEDPFSKVRFSRPNRLPVLLMRYTVLIIGEY